MDARFLLIFSQTRVSFMSKNDSLINKHKGGGIMLNCFDVADYFLALTCFEAGDLISNMKIQ